MGTGRWRKFPDGYLTPKGQQKLSEGGEQLQILGKRTPYRMRGSQGGREAYQKTFWMNSLKGRLLFLGKGRGGVECMGEKRSLTFS